MGTRKFQFFIPTWNSLELECVNAGYFKNLPNLTVIIFQRNHISDLDDFVFAQVSSVRDIHLQHNRLSVIRKNIFAGLPNLNKLYISFNKIQEIELESFKENSALVDLKIQENLLQSVSRCVFDEENYPKHLNTFFMHENPISCDRSICWLKEADSTWIRVGYRIETVCAEPAALNTTTWEALSTVDLNCDVPGGCY